jgi:DNA-directed RNA polymerase subunit RPC12/RpoP
MVPKLQVPEDMSVRRVRDVAHCIREVYLTEATGAVDELERIALTALIDCEALKAENQLRCPNCNYYGVDGQECEHCGLVVEGEWT